MNRLVSTGVPPGLMSPSSTFITRRWGRGCRRAPKEGGPSPQGAHQPRADSLRLTSGLVPRGRPHNDSGHPHGTTGPSAGAQTRQGSPRMLAGRADFHPLVPRAWLRPRGRRSRPAHPAGLRPPFPACPPHGRGGTVAPQPSPQQAPLVSSPTLVQTRRPQASPGCWHDRRHAPRVVSMNPSGRPLVKQTNTTTKERENISQSTERRPHRPC